MRDIGVYSVLVVVPVLNEARSIASILAELLEQSKEIGRTTIVVVDGGSTDGTQGIVQGLASQEPSIEMLHNPDRVQSAGVNLAVNTFGLAKDILVRCDGHSTYPRGYLRKLIESLDRYEADSVTVPMDSDGKGCIQSAIGWLSDTPVGSGGSAHRAGQRSGFVDHGHHAAMRMAKYIEAGGYDPTFTHNEDAEFDFRFRAFGGRIFLDADIRLIYQPRSTLRALGRQYFNYGFGRSRTMRRHPESIRLRQIATPVNLAGMALATAIAPVTPVFMFWPAAYVAALAAFSVTLALKKRSLCGLMALPAAVVMHNAWAIGFFWGILGVKEAVWRRPSFDPPTSAHTQSFNQL